MRIAYIDPDADTPLNNTHGSSIRAAQFVDALVDHGIEVKRFSAASKDDRLLLERLREGCDEIDLIYQRYSPGSLAGLDLAKRNGLPFFLEVDDPEVLNPPRRSSAIEDSVVAAADRVVVESPTLRQCALAGAIPRHKIRVLDYAVSPAVLATEKRIPRLPEDRFVVGYLGSLEPSKGTEILLDAFAELRRRDQRYRLLVVGGGLMQEAVKDFCKARHFEDCLEMTGRIPHDKVPAYLARMDAGLAPYPEHACSDTIPAKVWEYAAARVPIIASAGPTSELRELFPHKQAAMLTRPGDARDLAARTARLCDDIDLARSISRSARLRAKRATWSRVAAQVESLHKKFLTSQLYG